jgi:HEPN domain-containing protein
MGSEDRDPSGPHEWLRRARSNFARAAAEPANPDILLEDLCFDAQQTAEKAIKAVLVHRAIGFPRPTRSPTFCRSLHSMASTSQQACRSPRT